MYIYIYNNCMLSVCNLNFFSRVLTCWMKIKKMILRNVNLVFTRSPSLPPLAHAIVYLENERTEKTS